MSGAREARPSDDDDVGGLIRRSPSVLEVTNISRLFIRNLAIRFVNCPNPDG